MGRCEGGCGRVTANLDGVCGWCSEAERDEPEPDFEAITESRAMARRWVGDRV